MRPLLLAAVVATAASAHAAAQPPEDSDFDGSARALGIPAPTETWALDDGAGAELAWDDYDPAMAYAPRGGLHWGLEARVGVVPTESLSTSVRPQFEIHGFVDVRYAQRSPWRLRVGIAVGAEPYRSTNLGGGALVTSSAFSIRLRVLPLSIDLGRNLGLRAGGDFGLQVAPGPDAPSVLFDGAGLVQLVARTDDGRIEIGAYAGARPTGVQRLERPRLYSPYSQRSEATYVLDAVLGLSAGALF